MCNSKKISGCRINRIFDHFGNYGNSRIDSSAVFYGGLLLGTSLGGNPGLEETWVEAPDCHICIRKANQFTKQLS
jgi:hypothetical protein